MTLIRPAISAEAEELAALHVRTWQEAYAGLMPDDYLRSLDPAQRLPMWQRMLDPAAPTPAAIFVAEQEGRLIGFSTGGPSGDEDAEKSTGEIYSIYLLRDFWGRGIGRNLHETLLGELSGRYEVATLWVLESSERTRRWYERQGWVDDDRKKTEALVGATLIEVRYRRGLGDFGAG